MADTASRYGVELLGYSPAGLDANRNVRHRMRWRDADGSEHVAHTRGAVTQMLHGVGTGATVTLIRDGRGSIIAVEKRP